MGLKDIFGKKKDQKNDFKAMKLGDSKKPQNNSVKEPKNNTLDVQTNDFLHDKEHEKFLETLSTSMPTESEQYSLDNNYTDYSEEVSEKNIKKKSENNFGLQFCENEEDVQFKDDESDFINSLSTSLISKTEIKEDTKSEWIDLATENNQSGGLSFDESFEVKKEVSFLEKNNEKQFDNLKNDVLNKEENNFGDIMGTNNKDDLNDLNDLNSDSLDSNTKWEDSKKDDFDLTMDDITVNNVTHGFNFDNLDDEFDISKQTTQMTESTMEPVAVKKKQSGLFKFLSKNKKQKVEENNTLENYSIRTEAATVSALDDDVFKDTNTLERVSVSQKSSKNLADTDSSGEDAILAKQKKLPIIGNFSVKYQYNFAGAGLMLSLLVGSVATWVNQSVVRSETKAVQDATSLIASLEKYQNNFANATTGKLASIDNASQDLKSIKAKYDELENDLGKSSTSLDEEISQMRDSLKKMNNNVTFIASQRGILNDAYFKVNNLTNEMNKLINIVDKLNFAYIQVNGTKSELSQVFQIKSTIARINNIVATFLLAERVDKKLVDDLADARNQMKLLLSELYLGNEQKDIHPLDMKTLYPTYEQVVNSWLELNNTLDNIAQNGDNVVKAKSLSVPNAEATQKMVLLLQSITQYLDGENFKGSVESKYALILALLLLLASIIALFYIYSFDKDNRTLLEQVENRRNQNATLRLLNEMIPLQDGNLTKRTTVTDEITGAIADSINATVESLASLVKRIKDTSLTMREKTNDVSLISLEMLRSNELQTESLAKTGASVIGIAEAIDSISKKTKASASTAKDSINVAQKGAKDVFASIESMNLINQNMNETTLLTRKVVDSSKQISAIVELLSDITEETNILALNATVQAAKAGEAGKGFKIVADSIQELADNASEATRRVGALISAVQTDIQSVTNSVEKTTDEVARGVELSKNAGSSLQKITEESNNLADIVNLISKDAEHHAEIAKQVSKNMQQILEITEKSKQSTEQTANSITEIAEISKDLGESVQSFKVE